jgi:hypothetical protein
MAAPNLHEHSAGGQAGARRPPPSRPRGA